MTTINQINPVNRIGLPRIKTAFFTLLLFSLGMINGINAQNTKTKLDRINGLWCNKDQTTFVTVTEHNYPMTRKVKRGVQVKISKTADGPATEAIKDYYEVYQATDEIIKEFVEEMQSKGISKYFINAETKQTIGFKNDGSIYFILKVYQKPDGSLQGFSIADFSICDKIEPQDQSTSFKVDNNHDKINLEIKNMSTSDDNTTTKFLFSTASNVTWWKGIKVFNYSGQMVCMLTTQDNDHGPKNQQLNTDMLGTNEDKIKVEFWKAKAFGAHTHVGTKYYKISELAGASVSFKWMND